MSGSNRSQRTFNFCIGSFFSVSDVDHKKTFRCLIETHGEIIKFNLKRGQPQAPKCLNESTFIIENVNPKLVLVGAIVGA